MARATRVRVRICMHGAYGSGLGHVGLWSIHAWLGPIVPTTKLGLGILN
jgi:hypothetical protein